MKEYLTKQIILIFFSISIFTSCNSNFENVEQKKLYQEYASKVNRKVNLKTQENIKFIEMINDYEKILSDVYIPEGTDLVLNNIQLPATVYLYHDDGTKIKISEFLGKLKSLSIIENYDLICAHHIQNLDMGYTYILPVKENQNYSLDDFDFNYYSLRQKYLSFIKINEQYELEIAEAYFQFWLFSEFSHSVDYKDYHHIIKNYQDLKSKCSGSLLWRASYLPYDIEVKIEDDYVYINCMINSGDYFIEEIYDYTISISRDFPHRIEEISKELILSSSMSYIY